MRSISASQAVAPASDGIRQSPRGDSDPPALTFGPFGSAERLNWLEKNRRTNTSSQRRTVARSYAVRRSAGTAPFTRITGVAANDQFGPHGLDLLRPRTLCVPANKNDEDPNAPLSPQALLCYRTRQRVRFGELSPFINDQFVAQQVRIIRRLDFCVPSTIGDD